MKYKISSVLILSSFFLAILTLCHAGTAQNAMNNNTPVKVIIDTDLDSDVDDAGALAMLYNLHHAGEIELLGIIVTSDDPFAPVCAAALNTYYGLHELPVGFLSGQNELKNHSRYTRQIVEEFPSGIKTYRDAEDAVSLYRNILAQQPDESVVLVTIGHLSSLQQLLLSKADTTSDMNGIELSHKKINKWICMGGEYPQGKEANFYRPDPESTSFCIDKWMKEVIFCGWEAGNLVITGGERFKEQLPPKHPVYRAYELYNNFAGRQSWDQIAILQLIQPGRNLFSLVEGTCIVAPDGSNTWEDSKNGRHQYVRLDSAEDAESAQLLIEKLMSGKISVGE